MNNRNSLATVNDVMHAAVVLAVLVVTAVGLLGELVGGQDNVLLAQAVIERAFPLTAVESVLMQPGVASSSTDIRS